MSNDRRTYADGTYLDGRGDGMTTFDNAEERALYVADVAEMLARFARNYAAAEGDADTRRGIASAMFGTLDDLADGVNDCARIAGEGDRVRFDYVPELLAEVSS